MGRNKACELDNLLIEAIIMVAELNLLLKDYIADPVQACKDMIQIPSVNDTEI